MKYAKWAPQLVVVAYEQQRDLVTSIEANVAYEASKIAEMSESEWRESSAYRFFSSISKPLSRRAYLRDQEIFLALQKVKKGYYERLVSDERSREIWSTLSRHKVVNGLPDQEEGEREYMYAHWCWRAFESARDMPRHTFAEKSEHLNLIAAKAADLKQLFLSSPYFNHAHFIKKVASRNCPDFLGALIMSPRRKNDLTPEGKTTRSQQFVRLYESLSLEVVLDQLAEIAAAESKVAPKVKKIRSVNAERNYFVRDIHGYHVYRYGKPLWAMLAASTNVMFDLPASDSLSADDVRPLMN